MNDEVVFFEEDHWRGLPGLNLDIMDFLRETTGLPRRVKSSAIRARKLVVDNSLWAEGGRYLQSESSQLARVDKISEESSPLVK